MRRAFLLLVLTCLSMPFTAVHAAQVDGLQTPAWLERAGLKLPLRPGMNLQQSDILETGAGGRLIVRLADGSYLKLGERARLALEQLQEDTAPDGFYKGLLNLARGAFRFTAGAPGRLGRRDIEVQLVTTTVGIRGTDVWGRSKEGEATVCLIEGRVSVHHPARGELALDEPLSFFVAPRDAEPKPVTKVDPDKLKQWVAETELDLGKGVLLPGGGWIVQLGSHSQEATARRVEQRLLKAGIPVELTTVQLKDRTFYRLRVSGFDTRQDAGAFADRVRGQPGTPKPWVTCNIPGSSCQ